MKPYSLILFDLDGTLTDPAEGITNSVAYALNKFGIEVADKTQLYKFIGPPLADSFMEYYGFSEEQAQEAIACYRQYFTEKGMFENIVYEGIEELLKSLKSRGKRLCVATSKPEPFAKAILEHFNLAQYFECIAGATLDQSRVKKADVIAYALEKCGITDCSTAVMVGDREHDVFGATVHFIDCIGVLYGYGNRAELESAGALYIAAKPEGIGAFIG